MHQPGGGDGRRAIILHLPWATHTGQACSCHPPLIIISSARLEPNKPDSRVGGLWAVTLLALIVGFPSLPPPLAHLPPSIFVATLHRLEDTILPVPLFKGAVRSTEYGVWKHISAHLLIRRAGTASSRGQGTQVRVESQAARHMRS
jgi:hypothetical protein